MGAPIYNAEKTRQAQGTCPHRETRTLGHDKTVCTRCGLTFAVVRPKRIWDWSMVYAD